MGSVAPLGKCAWLLLSGLLLTATGAQAQWLSQSFTLKPGWNAIFLHVDASYTSLDSLLPDTNGPVAEVWLWKPALSTMQFLESPATPSPAGSRWLVWTSARGDTDTLTSLVGNNAYLVNNRTTTDFIWTVKGRPVPPSYQWTTTGLNFLGFPTPTNAVPTFASFLAPAPGLDLAKAGENQAHVFRYPGGSLGSNNPVEFFQGSAGVVPVTRGLAFWVRGSSNYYNRYYGPVEVSLQNPNGLHFGDSLGTYSLRLKNLTTTARTVTFNLAGSESAPAGQPAITATPRLLERGGLNATTLTYDHTVLTANRQFTLTPQGQVGSEREIILGLDRSFLTASAGSFYAGILRLTDTAGLSQIDLPVTATVPTAAGLWVGQATVSSVAQYLKSYPKADLSAADEGAEIDRIVALTGKPVNGAELPGAVWTARETNYSGPYSAVAASLDGQRAVAAVAGGQLYVSSNFGTNWFARPTGPVADAFTAVAWGRNGEGQTNVPAGLTSLKAIAAGSSNSLALKRDGTVVAWGSSAAGQITIPAGLSNAGAIAVGGGHCVALKTNGTVVAWGLNNGGQTNVPAGLTASAIAAGFNHTVALKSDGTVMAWGSNTSGQTNVPAGLTGVNAIAAGGYHTVALKTDGTIAGWGYNQYGQASAPTGLPSVRALAAGGYHTVALTTDGRVVAWGYNGEGQTNVPANLSGVVAVAAGERHTVALTTDGTVVAWGLNTQGQTTVPPGLSGVTALAAGGFHTVALAPIPRSWSALASAADGRVLAATVFNGPIYVSTDYGTSWTARDTNRAWKAIAASALGTQLAAVVQNGNIYTSADLGTTWTERDSIRNWSSVATSEDGTKLIAAANPGFLYTSTDSGASWIQRDFSRAWTAVASSADGTNLVATVANGQIYVSTNAGVSWDACESARNWSAVASSTDGRRLSATVANGLIYTSRDSGGSWVATNNVPTRDWRAIASSGDATRLVAVANAGQLFTLNRTFASYVLDDTTGLIHDQDGRYLSSGVNTTTNPVPSAFPLRLILHHDGTNRVSLLQRVFVGQGAGTSNTVVTSRQALLDATQLASARRISATHLPFTQTNTVWTTPGNFNPASVVTFTVALDYNDHASNPFLHTFHPDHDNLDAKFRTVLPVGKESYTVTRTVRLSFTPAGTDFRALTASAQARTGRYEETITFTAQSGATRDFRLSGTFALQRISPVSTLTTQ